MAMLGRSHLPRRIDVRDMIVMAIAVVYVRLGLSNTFLSYLLWGWAGLISLDSYIFGFMRVVPFVQVFALLTLGMLLFARDNEIQSFRINGTVAIMLLMALHGFFVAWLAYPGLPRNWEIYTNLVKTVLFCVIMPMLLLSRYRIHAMVVMLTLAISFHGLLDGLKFIASGGGHNAGGIRKFGDNNHFALVLLMILPLIYYLFQYSRHRLVQLGFGLTLPLIFFAVVATHSRGALVGAAAIVAWIAIKGRVGLIGLVLLGMSIFAALQFSPQDWTERMSTISEANEDESFLGRVVAWKVSSAIAVQHPLFGGGYRAVQSAEVWDRFKYDQGMLGLVDTPVLHVPGLAAHSIWFEVLGDAGIVGLLLFIALIANSFLARREIRQLTQGQDRGLRWAADLSDMLAASMIAYIVCGSLLSAAYFELPYVVIMMMEVLRQCVRRERALQKASPTKAGPSNESTL